MGSAGDDLNDEASSPRGAFFAQIGKLVVARVAVSPGDIHTGAVRNVNLDARWFFSRVERSRHGLRMRSTLGLAVAAVTWRNGIPMRAGLGMPEERADTLVQFGADDVFEFAGLRVRLGIVNGKSVL